MLYNLQVIAFRIGQSSEILRQSFNVVQKQMVWMQCCSSRPGRRQSPAPNVGTNWAVLDRCLFALAKLLYVLHTVQSSADLLENHMSRNFILRLFRLCPVS